MGELQAPVRANLTIGIRSLKESQEVSKICLVMDVSRRIGKSPLKVFELATLWAREMEEDIGSYHYLWLIDEQIPPFVKEYCQESLRRTSKRRR